MSSQRPASDVRRFDSTIGLSDDHIGSPTSRSPCPWNLWWSRRCRLSREVEAVSIRRSWGHGEPVQSVTGVVSQDFPGLLVISHLSRILGGALVASTVRPYCKSASVQSFHTGFLGKCMWVTHNDGGSRMSNPNLIPTVIGNNHSLWELVVHDEYRESWCTYPAGGTQ